MKDYLPFLKWLSGQKSSMVDLVIQWAKINTHAFNLSGLELFSQEVEKAFSIFNEKIERIPLPSMEMVNSQGLLEEKPLSHALKIQKRPEAPSQIFLMIHMDTVYPAETQATVSLVEKGALLRGPGVTDAKGGL
ncbi:MAG: hypothetical protein NUV91_04025, partial [Candidatus Omnitrophica bacterium]|nr:hypothetical protein [Candidatus Omnitrophota bacterium]